MPVDWRIERLRLTTFIPSDLTRQVPSWWRDIVGEDPPTQTVQHGVGAAHAGPIRNGHCQLILEVKAGRVDWLLAPPNPIDATSALAGFPQFDNLAGGVAIYRELLVPWAARIEDTRRIAVGAILTAQTENKLVAYQALQELLPHVEIDPENSSELLYQINRHARSRHLPELHLNRLSHWSAVRLKLLQLQLSAGAPTAAFSTDQPELHAVRLQLDINTDAERTDALPSGTIQPLVEELLGLGISIAEHGDQS